MFFSRDIELSPKQATALNQCPPSPTTAPGAAVASAGEPGVAFTGKLCDTFINDQIDNSEESLWETADLVLLSPVPTQRTCYAAPTKPKVCGDFKNTKSGRFAFDGEYGPDTRRLVTKPLNCTKGCQMRAWVRLGASGIDNCDAMDWGDSLKLDIPANCDRLICPNDGKLGEWTHKTDDPLYGGAWTEITSPHNKNTYLQV